MDNIGKYIIHSSLGNGHFGTVYHVTDAILKQKKAIKVIPVQDPSNLLNKLKEAEIQNKCRHKHIVQINEADVYEINGKPNLVIDMEFIDGGSLETQMGKRFISSAEARKIFIDILFGLEHAHSKNILHRDIKPANIMMHANGGKLADFGLASMLSAVTSDMDNYFPHRAPESYTGVKDNYQTDIFAMGVSLFRVINNITIWRDLILGFDEIDTLLRKGELLNKIQYNSFVSLKMQKIINKACKKDPSKRFKTAGEFRNALDKLTPKIEWIRNSPVNWEGNSIDGDSFTATISVVGENNKLEIKRNGRRINADCKNYSTKIMAMSALHQYISKNTFE